MFKFLDIFVAGMFFTLREIFILIMGIAHLGCWVMMITPVAKNNGMISWSIIGSGRHWWMSALIYSELFLLALATFYCRAALIQWKRIERERRLELLPHP